jgi:hypothetical protein
MITITLTEHEQGLLIALLEESKQTQRQWEELSKNKPEPIDPKYEDSYKIDYEALINDINELIGKIK